MRFSKVRQLLVDFQLIPAPSLDFQVGLNLDETAPLTFEAVKSTSNYLTSFPSNGNLSNILSATMFLLSFNCPGY